MKKIKLSSSKNFSFSSADRLFNFRTAIILGACRSGKTSLGTLVGSCKFVDNIEEPWTAKIITLMSGLKMIPESLSQKVLLNFITEIYNETVLFRTQSFRPTDMSSIWRQKSNKEIVERLTKYQTRQDVQKYIKKNNPLMLVNLTEVQPFISILRKSLNKIKLINVVRNGFEVANDCKKKKWFSNEQLKRPIKALPYKIFKYRNTKYHIPWWVNNKEEKCFLNYSEYERCVYYWCQTLETTVKKIDDLNDRRECITIKYSNLLNNTKKVFSKVCDYLNIKPTKKSYKLVNDLSNRVTKPIKIEKMNSSLKKRADFLNDHYGL
jgi:hypothetical protein